MKSREQFPYTYTVFTPTYNRATLLSRVYECLEKQTYRDFEWLVVDDGSTDNTAEVVKEFQAKASFPVRYVYKPNGGKPTAVNRGAREAKGFIFAILDSDDWYAPQALERFWHHWQAIPANLQPTFVGVTGLCCLPSNEMIGAKFHTDVFDSDVIDLRFKHRIEGEKSGVLRTEVMQQYQYPEDHGKYVSESLVWNRMAKSFKTRFINEVLTVKDYQPGGITDKGRMLQARDSKASLLSAKELAELGNRLPWGVRIRANTNYIRHSLHQGIPWSQQIKNAPSKLMYFLCFPMAVYLKTGDVSLLEEDPQKQIGEFVRKLSIF